MGFCVVAFWSLAVPLVIVGPLSRSQRSRAVPHIAFALFFLYVDTVTYVAVLTRSYAGRGFEIGQREQALGRCGFRTPACFDAQRPSSVLLQDANRTCTLPSSPLVSARTARSQRLPTGPRLSSPWLSKANSLLLFSCSLVCPNTC